MRRACLPIAGGLLAAAFLAVAAVLWRALGRAADRHDAMKGG